MAGSGHAPCREARGPIRRLPGRMVHRDLTLIGSRVGLRSTLRICRSAVRTSGITSLLKLFVHESEFAVLGDHEGDLPASPTEGDFDGLGMGQRRWDGGTGGRTTAGGSPPPQSAARRAAGSALLPRALDGGAGERASQGQAVSGDPVPHGPACSRATGVSALTQSHESRQRGNKAARDAHSAERGKLRPCSVAAPCGTR